jgi:hypothetical protein
LVSRPYIQLPGNNLPVFRDTVQSTGVLRSRSLPLTDSNALIKTFRHALALDEVDLANTHIISY